MRQNKLLHKATDKRGFSCSHRADHAYVDLALRPCLYILILAAITKLAMTDFTELSYQSWISVIIIVLVIILVLAIERGIRKKLKEEE